MKHPDGMGTGVFLIGLTGQTGAGKTTVSKLFSENGLAVINADETAKAVVAAGTPCLRALSQVFGQAILLPDGQMNRKAVAAMIFSDPVRREQYQAIIYPYITQAIRESVRQFAAAGHRAVILDAPTLFESGIYRFCHMILSVIADREIRKNRILSRDPITEEQAEQRIRAQYSEAFFRSHADAVLENNGDPAALRQHAGELILRIQQETDLYHNHLNLPNHF